MENSAIRYKMAKKCGNSKHKDIGIQTFFSSRDSVPDLGHTAQSDCDVIQVHMHIGTDNTYCLVNHNSVLDNSDPLDVMPHHCVSSACSFEGTMIIQNVANYLPNNTGLYPKRPVFGPPLL